MRITSRLATSITVLGLAAAMFRPVHAREAFAIASVRPSDPDSPRARERETQLIVQFREQAGERDVARVTRGARGRRSAFGNRYLLSLDAGFTTGEAMRRLAQAPEVEYAELNGPVHAFFK